MKDEYIVRFYNEVKSSMDGDYKIILEPNRSLKEDWIEYDSVKWEMSDELNELVDNLKKDNTKSFEEKVLAVYQYICLKYVYDANVLYFFRKDISDPNNIKYIAVDWYGRIVDEKWIEKRKKHNRRICYEFARFYAKAINTLLNGNDKLEAFMLGDKANTHYVVALSGVDYSAILDLDDFNSLKDLTRLKLGLTIKGIKILRDESGKLKKAVDEYNKDKKEELSEIEEATENIRPINLIEYFNKVVEILKKYNIDSQGFFEYVRIIVEREGIEIDKIWKEVKNVEEKRYARCFTFKYNSSMYLLDSVDQTLKVVDEKSLDKNIFVFNPEEHEYPYYGG